MTEHACDSEQVTAPILFVPAKDDMLVPNLVPKAMKMVANRGTTVFQGQYGHAEMMSKGFDQAANAMVSFLDLHLN
jgi:hypothetical protein